MSKLALQDRTHESYAKTYAVVFPHDEPLAGRNFMRSPLHDTLVRKGCVYQSRHGGERPGWFADQPAPVAPYDFCKDLDTQFWMVRLGWCIGLVLGWCWLVGGWVVAVVVSGGLD